MPEPTPRFAFLYKSVHESRAMSHACSEPKARAMRTAEPRDRA
jgi:hypothetical protein